MKKIQRDMNKLPQIAGWISWEEADSDPSLVDDYSNDHIESLVQYLRDNKVFHGGLWHQDSSCTGVPIFEDGKVIMASMRTWGGYVARAFNPDSTDIRDYCDFAWSHIYKGDKE